jgi:hypothetical protein
VISFLFARTRNYSMRFVWFPYYVQCFVNQIEVPVGRGKPPALIEKDESLDKVNFLMQQRHKTGMPFNSLFFLWLQLATGLLT